MSDRIKKGIAAKENKGSEISEELAGRKIILTCYLCNHIASSMIVGVLNTSTSSCYCKKHTRIALEVLASLEMAEFFRRVDLCQ